MIADLSGLVYRTLVLHTYQDAISWRCFETFGS